MLPNDDADGRFYKAAGLTEAWFEPATFGWVARKEVPEPVADECDLNYKWMSETPGGRRTAGLHSLGHHIAKRRTAVAALARRLLG